MSGGPSKTVRNERLKLRAAALNGIAMAAVVAGVVTPLAAATFGILPTSARGAIATAAGIAAWLSIGAGLHILAGRLLGGLRE